VIIGDIMSQITGAGFAPDAVDAGLNEALIRHLTVPLIRSMNPCIC